MPKQIQVHKHPSGRPHRSDEKRGWTYPRVPDAGPKTPGLKRENQLRAVGFTAGVGSTEMDWWGGGKSTRYRDGSQES